VLGLRRLIDCDRLTVIDQLTDYGIIKPIDYRQ